MSDGQIGPVVLLLLVLLSAAHLFGYLFTRLRQPRVIGEVVAGILLGPTLVGRIAPRLSSILWADPNSASHSSREVVTGFVYSLGLLFLMFVSGAESRRLFGPEDRRQVAWLSTVGTGVPFIVTLLLIPLLPAERMMGSAGRMNALVLVLGIAVAVTSIPVISRIFHDLNIMHTRFARLVLGVAVIEDIALWAVLAIATALAKSANLPKTKILVHVVATVAYLVVGLVLAPPALRFLCRARWNLLAKASPIGYLVAVMFGFCAVAALLEVNLVFAAFLAGYGVARDRAFFPGALDSLSRFSFAVFIPVYFLIVGARLDLGKGYSFVMLGITLATACVVKLLSVALGARLAGFRALDILNLAVAANARGGPGIVVASVAYDVGIVNMQAFTTLVLLAILTSQAAGAWLEIVLRKGWPLLSAVATSSPLGATEPDTGLQAA